MSTHHVTDDQIHDLRVEALRAGDLIQAALCERALGRTPSVPDDDVYARAMEITSAAARIECARVIADAAAQINLDADREGLS